MSSTKIAIITGAGSGIGKAIAIRLSADGFNLVVNDLPSQEAAVKALIVEIESKGSKAVSYLADISVEEHVAKMIDLAVLTFGALDVMVANAGINAMKSILDTTIDEIDRFHKINYHSVFLAYKYAAKQMIAQGRGGRIIGASSQVGKRGAAFLAGYVATKFAIRGLTQCAAQEWGKHGITVNAYCPGAIATPMNDRLQEDSAGAISDVLGADAATVSYKDMYAKACAVGRVGESEDVAGLVSFLASSNSSFITGQSIVIDGGVVFE